MIRLFIFLLLCFGVVSCSSNESPTKIYLNHLKNGNIKKAQAHQCIPESELQFPIVDSFDIISVEENKESNGLFYTEVKALVSTPSTQEEVIFWEWNSEDYFRDRVRGVDVANDLKRKTNSIKANLGLETNSEYWEYPDKSEITTKKKCSAIFLIPSRLRD